MKIALISTKHYSCQCKNCDFISIQSILLLLPFNVTLVNNFHSFSLFAISCFFSFFCNILLKLFGIDSIWKDRYEDEMLTFFLELNLGIGPLTCSE